MNFDKVTEMILELAGLKRFPVEDYARLALIKMVGEWTDSEDQVRGLVNEMLRSFDEWPGPKTFRQTFNRLYRPKLGPPEHRPFPSHSNPSWFIDWSSGRKALPAGDAPEVKSTEDLAAAKSFPKPAVRSKVHRMPVVKRGLLMWVRTEAEQAQFDKVAAEVERAIEDRKRGA